MQFIQCMVHDHDDCLQPSSPDTSIHSTTVIDFATFKSSSFIYRGHDQIEERLGWKSSTCYSSTVYNTQPFLERNLYK
jgi:hypothetical protein